GVATDGQLRTKGGQGVADRDGPSQLSKLQLKGVRQVVRTELRRERGLVWTHETLLDLRSIMLNDRWAEKTDQISSLLLRFIGTPAEYIPDLQAVGWPYTFTTYTTSGKWLGCSLQETDAIENELTFYDNCVLLHRSEHNHVDGATAIQRVFEE